MIFLVPGTKNTLRVRGRATIGRDIELRKSMEVHGRVPELALAVEVTTAYFRCATCIIRSKLWSPGEAVAVDGSLLAETMVKHGDLLVTVAEMQEIIVDDEISRLYYHHHKARHQRVTVLSPTHHPERLLTGAHHRQYSVSEVGASEVVRSPSFQWS